MSESEEFPIDPHRRGHRRAMEGVLAEAGDSQAARDARLADELRQAMRAEERARGFHRLTLGLAACVAFGSLGGWWYWSLAGGSQRTVALAPKPDPGEQEVAIRFEPAPQPQPWQPTPAPVAPMAPAQPADAPEALLKGLSMSPAPESTGALGRARSADDGLQPSAVAGRLEADPALADEGVSLAMADSAQPAAATRRGGPETAGFAAAGGGGTGPRYRASAGLLDSAARGRGAGAADPVPGVARLDVDAPARANLAEEFESVTGLADHSLERGVAPGLSQADFGSAREALTTGQPGWLSPWQAPVAGVEWGVDRDSFERVRASLAGGQVPPPEAVSMAGLLNSFRVELPSPADGAPLALITEVSACPWAPGHRLLRVALQARQPGLAAAGDGVVRTGAATVEAAAAAEIAGNPADAAPPPGVGGLSLRIEFNPGAVAAYRPLAGDFAPASTAAAPAVSEQTGALGAAESLTALFELVPAETGAGERAGLRYQPGADPALAAELGQLRLQWSNPAVGNGAIEQVVTDAGTGLEGASAEQRFAAGVVTFGFALSQGQRSGAAGLELARELVGAGLAADPDGRRRQLADLLDRLRGVAAPTDPAADAPAAAAPAAPVVPSAR